MVKNKASIVIVILAVVIVCLVGYIFFGGHERIDFRGEGFRGQFRNMANFSFDEETKNSIAEFFSSSPNIEEVRDYCRQNRMNCVYYCREVNPEHEVCNELARAGGGFGANFSGGGQ